MSYALAKACYEACPTPKPDWGTLSDITKSVWLEYVRAGKKPSDWEAPAPRPTLIRRRSPPVVPVQVAPARPVIRRRTR